MFCQKCGTEIPDGSAFCTNCGYPVGQPADTSQNYGGYNSNNSSYNNNVVQEPTPMYSSATNNSNNSNSKNAIKVIIAIVAVVLIAGVAFGIVKKKEKDQLTLRTNLNTAIHNMDDEILTGKFIYLFTYTYLDDLSPFGEMENETESNHFDTVDSCLSTVLDLKDSSDYSEDIAKMLDSYSVINHILFKQVYVDEGDTLYDMNDLKNAINDYESAKKNVRATMYSNMKPKNKNISDEKKEELKKQAYMLFETIGDVAQDFLNGDSGIDDFALADLSGDLGVNINDEMPYCSTYVDYKVYGSSEDINKVELTYYDIETGYCLKLSSEEDEYGEETENEEELDSYLAYTNIDISDLIWYNEEFYMVQ